MALYPLQRAVHLNCYCLLLSSLDDGGLEDKARVEIEVRVNVTTLDLPVLLYEMRKGSEKPSSQMLWNQDGCRGE